jgi:hypothetical protein
VKSGSSSNRHQSLDVLGQALFHEAFSLVTYDDENGKLTPPHEDQQSLPEFEQQERKLCCFYYSAR